MMHIQHPQQSPTYPHPPQYRPVPPGMMSNRSSVSSEHPPPLQRPLQVTQCSINSHATS